MISDREQPLPAHSDLPWGAGEVQEDEFGCEFVCIGPLFPSEFGQDKIGEYEDMIAQVFGGNHDAKANAKLIVSSVNYHENLIATLTTILGVFEYGIGAISKDEIDRARNLVQQAQK